ncbi:MAG: hypothetical protein JKY37_25370 [Nannocystaceae bacterium]|nr:hypothetical protein [Nannocystaceae bacterium]
MALLSIGCSPVFAPPVRTAHFGAPGRLAPGKVEVAAASSGVVAPVGMLGGNVGYAARRNLIVQAGVDGSFDEFALAWGGVQVPGKLQLSRRWSLAADAELGLGGGIGGRKVCDDRDDCVDDELRWYQRPAGGAYLGAGGAVRLGPVSLYSRVRTQLTGARGVPSTQWSSVALGLHGHILERADVWVGYALAHYANGVDSYSGCVPEIGLAFRFDPYLGWRR